MISFDKSIDIYFLIVVGATVIKIPYIFASTTAGINPACCINAITRKGATIMSKNINYLIAVLIYIRVSN